ncbi:glycoside hydrolase superfamily, partial [Clohesyomyces aquaticus]
ASYWTPPMKSNIQFILTGIPDVDDDYIRPNAGIYEVDMFYTPETTIRKMNELGQKVICYFSAATAENWRDDYKDFQKADLGKELPDWKGEKYLDIRRDNVFKVIKKRIDLAAKKGCNAIEPDNVDVYSNENGFKPAIVPDDTVKYLHKVSAYARSLNMSVGIKNCIEILGPIFDDVDFAISEQCVQYLNCTAYANFTTAPHAGAIGKPVFEVEY